MAKREKKRPEPTKKKQKRREYSTKGYTLTPRKWLWGSLGKNARAFTLHAHLVGSANFAPGKFQIGECPMSERDFAERLGWSITTVRKAMRFLKERGLVSTTTVAGNPRRGTIATIVNYAREQDFRTYENGSTSDPIHKTIGSENGPKKGCNGSENGPKSGTIGSENDPSPPLSYSLQLLLAREPFSVYFAQCPKPKRERELGCFELLLKDFDAEDIAAALTYVRTHQVPSGKSGELGPCHYPMAYLAQKFDWIMEKLKTTRKAEHIEEAAERIPEPTIEELEELLEKTPEPLRRPLQKQLESRRAQLNGGHHQ